jgi:hypothetical protein
MYLDSWLSSSGPITWAWDPSIVRGNPVLPAFYDGHCDFVVFLPYCSLNHDHLTA